MCGSLLAAAPEPAALGGCRAGCSGPGPSGPKREAACLSPLPPEPLESSVRWDTECLCLLSWRFFKKWPLLDVYGSEMETT